MALVAFSILVGQWAVWNLIWTAPPPHPLPVPQSKNAAAQPRPVDTEAQNDDITSDLDQDADDRHERLPWVNVITHTEFPRSPPQDVGDPQRRLVDLKPSELVSDEDSDWWSFKPLERPLPPPVARLHWSRNAIDQSDLM